MKNPFLVIIVLAIIVFAVFFIFKGDKAGGAMVITSADGMLELKIPKGALPKDVTKDDISITPVKFAEEAANTSGMLTYELKPDGLQFKKPVTAEFTIDLPAGDSHAVPILFHQTGEDEDAIIEVIDGTSVFIDKAKSSLVVGGEIDHFSYLAISSIDGFFEVTPTSASTNHRIGDDFVASFEIKPTGESIAYNGPRIGKGGEILGRTEIFSLSPDNKWCVTDGKLETSRANKILPTEQEHQKGCRQGTEQPFEISGQFTCEKEGAESVGTASDPGSFTIVSFRVNGPDSELDSDTVIMIQEEHSCTDKMMRIEAPTTIVCEESGRSYTGYPKKDPVTGEVIEGVLTELGTGEDIEVICP